MVGHLGVLRQKRPVQVGAHEVLVADAIGFVGLVVAAAHRRRHQSERLDTRPEARAARMVLVAHHRERRQRRAQHDIVDQAVGRTARGALGGYVDDAEPLHHFVAKQPFSPEDLIAPADGQQHAAVLHVRAKLVAHAHELARCKALLAVGATAQKHEIDAGQVDRFAMVHPANLHRDAAPAQPLRQNAHVAPVAVQVEQIGEEMRDDDAGCRRGGIGGGAVGGNGGGSGGSRWDAGDGGGASLFAGGKRRLLRHGRAGCGRSDRCGNG